MSCSEMFGEHARCVNTGLMFCGVSVLCHVRLVANWASNADSAASAPVRGFALGQAPDRRSSGPAPELRSRKSGGPWICPPMFRITLLLRQGDPHGLFQRQVPDVFFVSLFDQRERLLGVGHVGQPVGVDVGILDLGGHSLVMGQIAVHVVEIERLLRLAARQGDQYRSQHEADRRGVADS